uniref:Transmembrane protein 208 n=1 Tax=Parastrongyloides trichosuri TaxID=131310 RepID=A0A0N4Z9G0_PARTI
MSGKGKKLTKGQKQIHDENMATIKIYSFISYTSAVIFLVSSYMYTSTTWEWIGFAISFIVQNIGIGLLCLSAKSKKNSKGVVIDAGSDINDPESLTEYILDIIILASISHFLASFYGNLYLIMLIIPAFAIQKFCVTILIPWLRYSPDQPVEGMGKR